MTNNLSEIATQARTLMNQHGVGRLPFEFDRAKRRIAAMHYRDVDGVCIPVKITLSQHFATGMTKAEIEQTLLHEIAHALTPGHGHDRVWLAKARSIGYKGGRCGSVKNTVEPLWKATCPSCGRSNGQHRAPLRVTACAAPDCKHKPIGERIFDWYKNGELVADRDMPARYYAALNRFLLSEAFSKVG